MTPDSANLNAKAASTPLPFASTRPPSAFPLRNEDRVEVLSFLAQRPPHAVVMSGLIRDHGVESEFNRGKFYGCRNDVGVLEGVALIGHTTLIEARSDAAIKAFARVAQDFRGAHVIVGEQDPIARFWDHYAADGQPLRRLCREVLFEVNHAPAGDDDAKRLRTANRDELSLVANAHAAMAFDESGVDPLRVDAAGFLARCGRRIEQGRVWVRVENEKLIFKADVISDTPDLIYLEGIYVHPDHRGQGHGSRYLAQLARQLRQRTKSITALVNAEREQEQNFFQKLGFVSRGLYDTIFLQMQTKLP